MNGCKGMLNKVMYGKLKKGKKSFDTDKDSK